MMRIALFVLLAALLFIGGPTSSQLRPVLPGPITIQSQAVTIQPGEPSRTRVGALTLVGGWRLRSTSPQFGGLSALSVDGDRVTSLSDAGAIIRFRVTRFGRMVDARVVRLPPECGHQRSKIVRDTESLARDPASGDWWIGYEWRNAICRIDSNFSKGLGLARPKIMRNWRRAYGPEAMLRLPDGRFLVFAEKAVEGGAVRPLLIFDRDPTQRPHRVTALGYQPPDGYSPTDAALLPDGRILVINRRFSWNLFTSVLVAIDPATLKPGKPVEGAVLARFAPPLISDNFEGLAVTVERGKPYLWMVSDDNSMNWQATYLLKFAIDPPVTPPR